ncbi:hypothetical protein BJ138DRAFT_1237178, partial [Hygrophoropsis aurantiaca]
VSTDGLRLTCYSLHIILIVLHLCLVGVAVCHEEHRVIVPITSNSSVLTTVLSASLQAFYTLYTALLVFTTQRVSLSRSLSQRQSVTSIHDTAGAWVGLGTAFDSLWKQTKIASSPLEVFSVTAYLLCITVLHISSSSIMQFQNFNNTITEMVPTTLGWPDSPGDIDGIDWETIVSILPSVGLLSGFSAAGLTYGTIYDVLSSNTGTGSATVNATTVNANCVLLTGLTYNPDVEGVTYQCSNLPDGLQNGTYLMAPTPCAYSFITLPANVLNQVLYWSAERSTVRRLSHLYQANYSEFSLTDLNMYLVSCNPSIAQKNVTVDVQSNEIAPPSQVSAPSLSRWATPISICEYYSLRLSNQDWVRSAIMRVQANHIEHVCLAPRICQVTVLMLSTLVRYLMQLLGMNSSQINAAENSIPPQYSSNITPTFTLSMDQMENAVSEVLAQAIWTAGLLGEVGGGFNCSSGSAEITKMVLEMRLNVSREKLSFALSSSVILFAITIRLTCIGIEGSPKNNTVENMGVLELIWLASRSPELRFGVSDVERPSVDNLRAAGMFEVCLASMDGGDLEDKTGEHYEDGQGVKAFCCHPFDITNLPWQCLNPARHQNHVTSQFRKTVILSYRSTSTCYLSPTVHLMLIILLSLPLQTLSFA